jgi:outer membrane protein TolC
VDRRTQEAGADDHPQLRLALDLLNRESASAEVARKGNSSRPSVQVFWRGYGGDRMSPDINALGLGLAVPIGRAPSRGPEVARANEKQAQAQALVVETRRRLDLQLHEARHMLKLTGEQLENSEIMIEAANERQRLDQLAFDLGEFSVSEWLRRLSKLKEIQKTHELLLVQQGAAIAAYNQAVGESL